MLSRRAAEDPTLYEQLIRRGLPADYARRTAEELDDHRVDLLADVFDERTADERIGETRALAKKIAKDYRQRSWFGRWPLLGFVIAPVPLLTLSWCGIACVIWGGFELLEWFVPGFDELLPSGQKATMLDVMTIAVRTLFFLATPALLAWGYGQIALKRTQSRACVALLCGILGLANGLVAIDNSLVTENDVTTGSISVGVLLDGSFASFVDHYVRPWALGQLLAPMLVGGVLLWRDDRRRATLLATALNSPAAAA